MKPIRLKRVITGYRCHEMRCYSTAVWYVETTSEFFHWCPKHAVSHMRDEGFWKRVVAEATRARRPSANRATQSRRSR